MSDTLPRDLWIRQLEALPPRTVLSTLTTHAHKSTSFTDHLADYLRARAAVEAEYAQSLQKVQRKYAGGDVGIDSGDGVAVVWERLTGELAQTIKSHTDYSSSLTRDYAEPLRSLAAVSTSSADRLERTLKSYESANAKITKAQRKGGAKLLAAQQDAQDLQRELGQHLVPEFVALHQQTTTDRLTTLKELAVKWETHQSDMGNRRAEASEQGMMRVLGWEPEEQVRDLALVKFGGVAPGSGQPQFAQVATPTRSSTIRRPTLQSDASSLRASPQPSDFAPSSTGGGGGGGFASTLKSKFGRKNSTLTPSRQRAGSDAPPMRQQSTDPASAYATPLATPLEAPAGRAVDGEGFSVPPPDRSQAPWERPAARRDLLDDDDSDGEAYPTASKPGHTFTALPTSTSLMDSPSTANTNKFSTLALAPAPITESESERAAALAKMQNTLLSSGPSTGPSRRATMRARRDVRNTMFTALDKVDDEASLGETVRRQRGSDEGAVVTPSFARGEATSEVASPISMTVNPFEGNITPGSGSGPGLRASFVETVSAVIQSGIVQRLQITGEVSLSLKDLARTVNTSIPLHIRLDAFEQLEKVAPNPKYLSQVPSTPGEYLLDLDTLSRVSAAGGKGPILFKYQVHIGDGRAGEWAPLGISAQWKPMQGETRLVLTYNANTDSRLASRLGDAAIRDLKLTVALGGDAPVTAVQAKPPGGTWSPEARKITWTLPDLSLSGSESPATGKIVARFITTGQTPAEPDQVFAQFRVDGGLSTGLGVSIVDQAVGWEFEEVKRAVVSGKYVAE